MSKFSLFLGRSLWNAISVALVSSIGGVIVYFGNKHMILNTFETARALIVMFLVGVGFLTLFFLVREYINEKYDKKIKNSDFRYLKNKNISFIQ